MRLSLVIPCKDINDPKLKELLASIEAQDFNKDELETLIITEGTSESAKAIGIRCAKGEVIGILASDNELTWKNALSSSYKMASEYSTSAPSVYHYKSSDDVLNRYFSLIGGNDVLSFYMRKNDKWSYAGDRGNPRGSIGDNGFFCKRELLLKTDLDNYYHVDNAIEACGEVEYSVMDIWHKTGGNIFHFFAKRYRYGLQHAFNKNRRWHLVDFSKPQDIRRLLWFILASLTIIHPLFLSFRGYRKIQDLAWFYHPIVCLMTIFTYTILMIHLGLRRLFQSLSAPTAVQKA